MKLKAGDRVTDRFWGDGEIVRTDCGMKGFHLVLFDIAPSVLYNLGENPCCVFDYDLTLNPSSSLHAG